MPRRLAHRPAGGAAAPAPALDGVAIAVAALALYVALGQDAFYKLDGQMILGYAKLGSATHPWHFLFLPVLRWCSAWTAELGVSTFRTGVLLGAAGTACGVLGAHAGLRRLGLGRADAALGTLLVAASAPVLFFATVLEFHGFFFAFAGLAFAAAATLARRPTAGRALALGGAMGGAFLAHSTGACLPAALLPFVLAWRTRESALDRRALWRLAVLAALACAVLLAVVLGLDALARARPAHEPAGGFSVGTAEGVLAERAARFVHRPWAVLGTLWNEWVWPYAPLSVAFLLGWRRRVLRPLVLALAFAVAAYSLPAMLLLGDEEVERGAYLLPLAPLAALLAVLALPRRAALLCAAASLALGIAQVVQHDRPGTVHATARAITRAAGTDEVVLIVGTTDEWPPVLRHLDRAQVLMALWLAPLPGRDPAAHFALVDRALDDALARGVPVLLTRGAEAALRAHAGGDGSPSGADVLAHLRARYACEEVGSSAFAALRLRGR